MGVLGKLVAGDTKGVTGGDVWKEGEFWWIFGVKREVTWSGLLLKMGVDVDNFEEEGFGVDTFSSTG